MTQEHLVVVAIAAAQAGKEEELKSRLEGVATASWDEPGVVSYAVHDLREHPGSFMMVEVYTSQAGFDAHLETPHVKALIADLGSLVEGELVVHQGTATDFSRGPKGVL
jgi:quinol monooxygenase YgiN